MTGFLSAILGRLPIGWLQLTHSRMRLISALAGVAFANVLVLVQLGISGALSNTILTSYNFLNADIMISAHDANTMTEGGRVARARMFQAMSVPGVDSAIGFHVNNVDWTTTNGISVTLQVYGLDPSRPDYLREDLRQAAAPLDRINTIVVDMGTRGADMAVLGEVIDGNDVITEINDQQVTLVGTMDGGAGFSADGYALASDQTFARLVPSGSTNTPRHILLKIEPDADIDRVLEGLRQLFDGTGLRIRTVADAAAQDQQYQTTERPTGLIFGFGVVIGILVGIVIVYQVLSTDVADHLKEYATFKAMGYSQSFFIGVVMEEAVILAAFGFLPGLAISAFLYWLLSALTGLPMILTATTAAAVFVGTIIACALSGALATRRLASANPADLF